MVLMVWLFCVMHCLYIPANVQNAACCCCCNSHGGKFCVLTNTNCCLSRSIHEMNQRVFHLWNLKICEQDFPAELWRGCEGFHPAEMVYCVFSIYIDLMYSPQYIIYSICAFRLKYCRNRKPNRYWSKTFLSKMSINVAFRFTAVSTAYSYLI